LLTGVAFFPSGGTTSRAQPVHELKEDCMKQDRPPLTFRQQGILAAVMGVAMLGFYTLLGVLQFR